MFGQFGQTLRFQVMLKHTLWKNQPFPVALGAYQQHAPPNAINGHHPALGSQVGKPETLGVVVALEDREVRRELLLALQRPPGLPPRVLVVHTLPFVQAVPVDDERDDDVSLRGQELLDDVRREEGQVAVYPQHPVLLAQGGLEQSVARLRHVSAAASLVLLAVHDAPRAVHLARQVEVENVDSGKGLPQLHGDIIRHVESVVAAAVLAEGDGDEQVRVVDWLQETKEPLQRTRHIVNGGQD